MASKLLKLLECAAPRDPLSTAEQGGEGMHLRGEKNSQCPQASRLHRGTGKCNSLMCPGGEKQKHLSDGQSDNHKRFTDWGNCSNCLDTRAEIMGLTWVGGYILQKLPPPNTRPFSVYYTPPNALWGRTPGPSWPCPLTATDLGQFAYLGIIEYIRETV